MKTILVCVDFSDVTPVQIETASTLARAFGAELYLIHVAAPDPGFVPYEAGPVHERQWRADVLRKEHREIQAIAEPLSQGGIKVTPLLVQGPTVAKILEEADRLAADLIVVGSHGHGAVFDLLVGSATDGVLRKSQVPVLVTPSPKR